MATMKLAFDRSARRIDADVPKNVWIHGSITYVYTGSDYTPPGQDTL